MRLIDFQNSSGVPRHEMICLLQNQYFTGRFYPVIDIERTQLARLRNWLFKSKSRRQEERNNPKISVPQGNSILFFGSYEKPTLPRVLKNGLPTLFLCLPQEHSYVIVIGKCGHKLDEQFFSSMPENISRIFISHLNVSHPRASYLPLGRDYRAAKSFNARPPQQHKDTLLYCNFSVSTHPVREEIYQTIKREKWIKFEHMGKFLNYSISHDEFLKHVAGSKFVLCPRGHNVDTYRMWDALYLGSIPVVVKEAPFHEDLTDLPILFLDQPSDVAKLTPEFLEATYQRMLITPFNYKKLYLSHWLKRIYNSADFL